MGGFRLAGSDGKIVAIANRRARGLLAYLLFAPEHAATRERLCGLLWSDRGEAQARASLRQCLLELRNTLASAGLDLLESGREQVSLRAGALECDVADLERALVGADPETLASMLATAGATRLLDDLEIGGLFRDWLDQTRARLDQTIAAGVLAHLARLEAAGDWARVRAIAEAYLRRDPLDEAVVATAIRADVAMGAASTAHRRFQILQAALAREFGVLPGAGPRDALAAIGAPPMAARASATAGVARAPPSQGASGAPPLVIVAAFDAPEATGAENRIAATLRDEVLSGLSRFRDLRVVTDPRPLDLVAADDSAERAGAYALGASLRASTDGRRLIVQLLRSGQRHIIWSNRFDLPHLDVVGAIDDIIAQVVGAVLPTINADLMRRPSHLPSDQAYQKYLLARDAAMKAPSFDAARSAASQLEAMVTSDPGFALPYLPLVYLYNNDFGYTRAGSSGTKETARAFQLAKNALALDRGHVHAYTVTGWCHLRRRQWGSARAHFEQALELNPFHATRVMEAAFGLLFLGELERARGLLDRCLLLNPTPDDHFFQDLGFLELMRGDHDRAASYFELVAEPTIWGLVYTAMNAQLGGHGFAEKTAHCHERLSSIWPAETPMNPPTVVEWMKGHHPFQAPDLEDAFLSAARRALGAT